MSTGQLVSLTDGPFDVIGIEVQLIDLKQYSVNTLRGPLSVLSKILTILHGTSSRNPQGFVEIVGLKGISKPSLSFVSSELRSGLCRARNYGPYQPNGSEAAAISVRMLYAHKCGDTLESTPVTTVYFTSNTAYRDAVAEFNFLTRNRVLEIQVHDRLMSVKSLTTSAPRA